MIEGGVAGTVDMQTLRPLGLRKNIRSVNAFGLYNDSAGDSAFGNGVGQNISAIVEDLVRLYGPEASKPTWYIDRDWTAEEFSGGCYSALFGPGQLTALGPALREPVGLLHFAGCETATRWIGYMDGALQAGERAADEILSKV